MVEKNQEIEAIIDNYGNDGQGVARHNGFVIFVPFSIVGERVKVHIIYVSKNYAVGKIVEVLEASTDRIKAPCPYYEKCGGCSIQHIKYSETLKIKEQNVSDCISKIGGFKEFSINDVIGSDLEYQYRNKSAFPICVVDGNLEISMFKRLSHNNVIINQCLITDDVIVKSANEFIKYANLVLNSTEKEQLKYFVARFIDNKLLITIVTNSFTSKLNGFGEYLKKELGLNDGQLGIYLCKKNIDNNVILEGDLKHIFGISAITTNFMGIDVEISPFSFFQVNVNVMKKLYNFVLENIKNEKLVVDAYSGAGLMSALLARKAEKVYAIEIVKQATENANYLKKVNKIDNLVNINGDASEELTRLVKNFKQNFTLVLDPPRKGVSEKVLSTILTNMPSKIVYVSCDPATLARDLKVLSNKYELINVQPFDMFPQTSHVETVAVLNRKI